MAQPKMLASLSSTLLARKGHAKPAMRPQGFGGFTGQMTGDDLGWNDMGADAPSPPEAPAIQSATQPMPKPTPVAEVSAPAIPAVLVERAALAEELTGEPPQAVRPVSAATAARIGRDAALQTAKGKAAFTLRLDADRHLRLRLASAVANRSAQALVSAALDSFLKTLPEVETLVAQLPSPAAKR